MTINPRRLAVLISGRGSNLRAIVEASRAEGWPAEVAAVVSNRPDAGGLAYAREQGIATEVVDHRAFAKRESFDAALATALERHAPDAIALAGFMRVLGAAFVERFAGRLVNIHPSLLPAFAGLDTHRRAIGAGCKVAGATVHFVTAELDHGPIIAQAVVPIHADDDAEALGAKVLAREHVLYPLALRWLLEDRLRVEGGIVRHVDGAPQWLL